jgi:hypothetical protein
VSELSYAQSEDRSQATKLPTQAEDRDRDRLKSRFKEFPVPKLRADLTSKRIAVVLGSHTNEQHTLSPAGSTCPFLLLARALLSKEGPERREASSV